MGIDVLEQPELVFLAESALFLELPLGWERVELAENAAFYRNSLLRQKQWQHPQLTYLVALARALTAEDSMQASEGAV
jgi:hypothetical protein